MALRYNTTDWQNFLFEDHKRVEPTTRQAEVEGSKRYEAFSDFSSEVFHRFYTKNESPMDEPAAGSEWAEQLHQAMTDVPEFEQLRDRCKGNDWWAGISTGAMIDTILKTVTPPKSRIEDPRKDEEVAQYLDRLATKTLEAGDEETAAELDAEATGRALSAEAKVEADAEAAQLMDPTKMRNAIRAAAEAATEEIDAAEAILAGFGIGSGAHSGQRVPRGAGRKLASTIQDSNRLRRIAELAGRLKRVALERQRAKPRRGTDEVTGITQGDDLARLLPSEALYAIDPELEVIFARRMQERGLLNYELNQTPPKERGPIVMLLDSSGSMTWGDADVWGAAVALAFLEIAQQQGRAFCLKHFGTEVIESFEFPAKKATSTDEVIEAATFFDNCGGTCFKQPLDEAVEMIENADTFEDADIVLVTDGGAKLDAEWIQSFATKRDELGCSLYSILVGNDIMFGTTDRISDQTVHLSDALTDESKMHHLFGEV